MFNPIKVLKEVQSQRKMLNSLDKAEKYFDGQKNSIIAIKETQGYKEIKDYWLRVWEAGVQRMTDIESNDIAKYKMVQGQIKQAQDFIDFLENLESDFVL